MQESILFVKAVAEGIDSSSEMAIGALTDRPYQSSTIFGLSEEGYRFRNK